MGDYPGLSEWAQCETRIPEDRGGRPGGHRPTVNKVKGLQLAKKPRGRERDFPRVLMMLSAQTPGEALSILRGCKIILGAVVEPIHLCNLLEQQQKTQNLYILVITISITANTNISGQLHNCKLDTVASKRRFQKSCFCIDDVITPYKLRHQARSENCSEV